MAPILETEGAPWETKGDKTLEEAHTHTHKSKKRNKKWYNGRQMETRPLGTRTHHPTKANKEGDAGRQGRQDPWKGGPTIQQKETRRRTMKTKGGQDPPKGGHTIQRRGTEGVQSKTKGDKTLGKADTPSKKGRNASQNPQEGRTITEGVSGSQDPGRQTHHPKRGTMGVTTCHDPREGGRTIQEGVQWETLRRWGRQTHHAGTMGVKTLTKADTPSKKGCKWSQNSREGGRTIQHQGGHLKEAFRTPNGRLFGEKRRPYSG